MSKISNLTQSKNLTLSHPPVHTPKPGLLRPDPSQWEGRAGSGPLLFLLQTFLTPSGWCRESKKWEVLRRLFALWVPKQLKSDSFPSWEHFWELSEDPSQPSANIFYKRPGSKFIRLRGSYSLSPLLNSATDKTSKRGCGCVPVNMSLQKQPASLWAIVCQFLGSPTWGSSHGGFSRPGQMAFILWLLTPLSSLWKEDSTSSFSSPEGWCFSRGPLNRFKGKTSFLLFSMGSPDQVNGKCSWIVCLLKKLSWPTQQSPSLCHQNRYLGTSGPYILQSRVRSKSTPSNAGTQGF